MAIELTPDELTWLRASLRGKTPMITKVVSSSLVAKGLMTPGAGGPVLSDAGKEWLMENGYVWVPRT
ncbi:MAG: hypothetical protein K8R60_10610 [Burkholderiales bacterium]|nr:hypothetical protein [Burkholderiales bacterium]